MHDEIFFALAWNFNFQYCALAEIDGMFLRKWSDDR